MTITLINGFVLLSHAADWRVPATHRRVWQSEVAEALRGGESRNALRAVARRSLTWTVTAETLPERIRLEARLDDAKFTGLACAPFHGRGAVLSNAAHAGDNSLTLSSTSWTWAAGDYAILLRDDLTFDCLPVTGVAGSTLNFGPGTLNLNWPSGQLVWPLLFGTLASDKASALDGQLSEQQKITITELTSARSAQIGITPAAKLGIGQMAVGAGFTVGGKPQ